MTHQTTITPDPDGNGFILHLPEITHLDTQVWSADVGLTAEGLAALRTALAAVSAAVAPPTQAALRDRLTTAISRWHRDPEQPLYEQGADAVLAVLPEPADRAAVLADVERAIRAATGNCGYKAEDGCDFCNGVDAALDQVRRMADETATETPQPSLRDQHRAAWHALTPDQQTARIAELDEPAAGARQDEPPTRHTYLSTGCLHGHHDYCQSHTGHSGTKTPAQCKFCAAPCTCHCHQDGAQP